MREPIASAINWTNPGPGGLGYETDDGSLFYGVDKWSLQPLDECVAESGYAFRYGVPPTPQQLHASCAASACIELANTMISGHEFAPHGVEDDVHSVEYDDAMDDWVQPMIDYCMLHHIPGEPCPTDPLAQLLLDLKPIVDVCEAQSRVSIMGVIERGIRARESYMASSGSGSARDAQWEGVPGLGGYDPDVAAMCAVPECDNLMYRLHMKFQMMGSCPFAQRYDVYNPLVSSYMHLCDLSSRVTWYDRLMMFARGRGPIWYAYLPGPLPLAPSLSPSPSSSQLLSAPPSPSPSPPVSSSSEPTPTAPTESGLQTLPTTTPTSKSLSPTSSPASTLQPRPTASPNKRQQTRAVNGSTVVQPARANRTVPLPPTLASVDGEVTTPDTTTVASLKHQSGGSAALQYSVAAIVAVAVLTLLFVVRGYRRRRRAEGASALTTADDNGIGYHTLNDSDQNGGISTVPSSTNPLALLATCTEIPASQISDLRILGGGGFGIVYLVRDTQHDRLLASKRLAPKHIHAGAAASAKNDELDAFVAEINLAASLAHERIVAFVGVAGLHKTALQALFEYMDGGDLRQYLDQRRPIADADAEAGRPFWTSEKLQIAVDVAEALAYLHSLTPTPVVHRDLKSRNILLTAKDKRAKLGDFGVSRAASTAASMTTGVGTSRWVAPEVILGGGAYGAACDVYSLGVVLSELDTHRVPFSELAHANGEPLADFAVLELVATQGRQPSFSAACPVGLLSLARACLSFEATLRPSAFEVGVALRAIQSKLYGE